MVMFIYSYILICTESALHHLFSHNATGVCILPVIKWKSTFTFLITEKEKPKTNKMSQKNKMTIFIHEGAQKRPSCKHRERSNYKFK